MARQSNTLTLADRTDLAPRARQLLAQQLAECGGLLAPLVKHALDDLEQELFRIAERSTGGQAQHEALDALPQIRSRRARFHPDLMVTLEHSFARIGRAPADAEPATRHDGADLALVDPHEQDESMALDDLAARTELHAGNAVFDLCHRYAVLIAAPPFENDDLPPGPHSLASALAETATGFGLQHGHRLLLYRLCDRRLFGSAEAFYTHLNEHLKAAGILPDLRSYLPRRARPARGAGTATPPAVAAADATAADSTTTPTIGPVAGTPEQPLPDNDELRTLLAARRRALHPEAAAAAAQSAQFASMPELQEALAALQALPLRHGPERGERLTGEVLDALRHAAPNHDTRALQPQDRDAVELVGMLYDQLIAATRAEGIAQQLLAKLQVPLLRVALTDHDFFTTREHPARRLLSEVLETANLWLDRSDERFDNALNQRLQRSVQRVVDEYKGDVGVIQEEADTLDAHLQMLARRAEIAERRQVEAARGRDRLQTARATARKALAARLAQHPPTPLVRALLENAWTDVLTLTLLRHGEDSEAYRRQLAAADELLNPAPERDTTRLAADLNRGLTQVGLQAGESDHVTRYALDLPLPPAAAGTPAPSQTELLVRLKSRRPPEAEAAATAPPEPRPLSLTPHERRALEQLQALPFGTWLEFTVNQQGLTAARKLAWYAPQTGRCLLVSARGVAAPERTLEQVARLLARGQIRIVSGRGGGMLDRAWNALLGGLRRFGHAPAPAEAAP